MSTLEKPESTQSQLTKRQIANKANAQLSTGARTPEGKAKVAMNALKHGLSAKAHIVIPGESSEEFQDFQSSFLTHFDPADPMQLELVDRIVISAWKLRRLAKTEGDYLRNPRKRYAGHQPLPYDDRELFIHLQRYETNIERSFHKAIATLTKLQKESAKTNPPSVRWTLPPADSGPGPEIEETNPIPKLVREFPFIEEPHAKTNPTDDPSQCPIPGSTTIAGRSQTTGRATTDDPTPETVAELPVPNQQTEKTNPITENPSVQVCETPCNSDVQKESKTPANQQTAAKKKPTTNYPDLDRINAFLRPRAGYSLKEFDPVLAKTEVFAGPQIERVIDALVDARKERRVSFLHIATVCNTGIADVAEFERIKKGTYDEIYRYAKALMDPDTF